MNLSRMPDGNTAALRQYMAEQDLRDAQEAAYEHAVWAYCDELRRSRAKLAMIAIDWLDDQGSEEKKHELAKMIAGIDDIVDRARVEAAVIAWAVDNAEDAPGSFESWSARQ